MDVHNDPSIRDHRTCDTVRPTENLGGRDVTSIVLPPQYYISDLPQLHGCCFYVTPFNSPGFRRILRPVGVRLQVPPGVAAISL